MYLYPFNHKLWGDILRDPEIEFLFSAEKMMNSFIRYEVALTNAIAKSELITKEAQNQIYSVLKSFEPNYAALQTNTAIDGMVVPELVRQIRNKLDPQIGKYFHYGSTSQDLIDTGLIMSLVVYSELFLNRHKSVLSSLKQLLNRFGDNPLKGKTRYQFAKEIDCKDRIGDWVTIIDRHSQELENRFNCCKSIQFGGPVGNRKEWGRKSQKICDSIAHELGLNSEKESWHTDRLAIVRLAMSLIQYTSSLGKISKDLLLMAQSGEVTFTKGGKSSAMPHKTNPITPEIILSISHYLNSLSSGVNTCLIHEQERSGSMWTLEWLVVPQICILAGKCCSLLDSTLNSIELFGSLN